MDILWEKDAYALVPTDLGLVQKLQWSTELPAGWTNDKAYRTHEETLQTLLSFHLAEVCGEPVQLVGSAGDHWSGADIIGLDTLGRIHLWGFRRTDLKQKLSRRRVT